LTQGVAPGLGWSSKLFCTWQERSAWASVQLCCQEVTQEKWSFVRRDLLTLSVLEGCTSPEAWVVSSRTPGRSRVLCAPCFPTCLPLPECICVSWGVPRQSLLPAALLSSLSLDRSPITTLLLGPRESWGDQGPIFCLNSQDAAHESKDYPSPRSFLSSTPRLWFWDRV
jgi:hypothetical protein